MSQKYCDKCKKITDHNFDICCECKERNIAKAKQKYEDNWNKMSVDEKLLYLRDRIDEKSNNTSIYDRLY